MNSCIMPFLFLLETMVMCLVPLSLDMKLMPMLCSTTGDNTGVTSVCRVKNLIFQDLTCSVMKLFIHILCCILQGSWCDWYALPPLTMWMSMSRPTKLFLLVCKLSWIPYLFLSLEMNLISITFLIIVMVQPIIGNLISMIEGVIYNHVDIIPPACCCLPNLICNIRHTMILIIHSG